MVRDAPVGDLVKTDRGADRAAWIAQLRRDYLAGTLDLSIDVARDRTEFARLIRELFAPDRGDAAPPNDPPPNDRPPNDRPPNDPPPNDPPRDR